MHRAQTAAAFLQSTLTEPSQIGLLTEPYAYKNKCIALPAGFKAVPRNATEQRPRAAIFHHHSLELVEIRHLSSRDCVVALVPGPDPIVVVSMYLDILEEIRSDWLRQITNFAAEKQYKLVIGMDSNAHSTLFGGDQTNSRGEALEEIILQLGLMIENDGEAPTFEVVRNLNHIRTFIDITLSNHCSLLHSSGLEC